MRYIALGIICLFLFCAGAKAAPKKQKPPQWTVEQTIQSALDYSPALKSSNEDAKMAEEGVAQARAGHLPKLNVEASAGGSTLPVAKYE